VLFQSSDSWAISCSTPERDTQRPAATTTTSSLKYLHALVQQHGPQLQKVYEASKEHATRSKGNDESLIYRAQPHEVPTVPPQLTSELLHCLSTLPDTWPLAKITIKLGHSDIVETTAPYTNKTILPMTKPRQTDNKGGRQSVAGQSWIFHVGLFWEENT